MGKLNADPGKKNNDEKKETRSTDQSIKANSFTPPASGIVSITDNRPETLEQKELQNIMNNSPQVRTGIEIQSFINNSSLMKAERERIADLFGGKVTPPPISTEENKTNDLKASDTTKDADKEQPVTEDKEAATNLVTLPEVSSSLTFSIGRPGGKYSSSIINFAADVRYIQKMLKDIGLLSDSEYEKEYPKNPEKKETTEIEAKDLAKEELMVKTYGKAAAGLQVSSTSIPATIRAIEIFQREVKHGGVDGRLDPGGKSIALLSAATKESVAKARAEYAKKIKEEAEAKKKEEELKKKEAEAERKKLEEIERLKNEKTDTATLDRILELHGDDMRDLGREMRKYAPYNPELVVSILNHMDWSEKDNLAYNITSNFSDAELASLDKSLLKKLSDELESGWTKDVEEKEIERITIVLNSKGTTEAKKSSKVNVTNEKLGSLSETYESGGRGCGTVSTGSGDYGGVSYGTYQFASNLGIPEKFLNNEGKEWKEKFKGYKSGTKEFSKIWKEIAISEKDKFADAQHKYVEREYFKKQAEVIKTISGLDVMSRSKTLRDVVWSTAVQHGGNTKLIGNILKNKDIHKITDKEIIELIYAERGKEGENGNLKYFKNSSKAMQNGIRKRYKNELNDALNQLK